MTAPDQSALKRRVLLTAAVTLAAFLVTAYVIAWLSDFDGSNNGFLIPAVLVIYLCVTRPLMHPVREAIKLRRRLAYQAWLDEQGKR